MGEVIIGVNNIIGSKGYKGHNSEGIKVQIIGIGFL